MNKDHPKVVMTDYDFPSLEIIRVCLKSIDAEFIAAQCKTSREIIELCRDAEAVITEYFNPIDRDIIQHMQRCLVIVRTGVGFDTVDLEAATEQGIYVVNIPAYCIDEVSDHALSLLLACVRKIPLLNNSVKSGEWDFKIAEPIPRLRGQTLGIVGYGRIGQRLMSKAAALGLEVIACDPYNPPKDIPSVTLEELIRVSDIVSIHTPLTDETRGMFGHEEMHAMKPTAILINTARGPIVQLDALHEALAGGEIASAGLDVHEKEPIDASHPILKMDNFIATPHCAWLSEGAKEELLLTVAQEVVRAVRGQRPASVVNPEVDGRARATSRDRKNVAG